VTIPGRSSVMLHWSLVASALLGATYRSIRELVLDARTDSATIWSTICSWMHICDTSHHACHEALEEQWHPRRSVELMLADAGQDSETVRVVEVPIDATVRYAALSHRWGGVATLTLTSTSRLSLEQGIRRAELPRTFQDALVVLAKLGLT